MWQRSLWVPRAATSFSATSVEWPAGWPKKEKRPALGPVSPLTPRQARVTDVMLLSDLRLPASRVKRCHDSAYVLHRYWR
jgi:hypothetical protein